MRLLCRNSRTKSRQPQLTFTPSVFCHWGVIVASVFTAVLPCTLHAFVMEPVLTTRSPVRCGPLAEEMINCYVINPNNENTLLEKNSECRRRKNINSMLYSANGDNAFSLDRNVHKNQQKLTGNVPQHVAFVCDGNSRWATRKGLPTAVGHAAGADRLVQLLQALKHKGVTCCTMYGFSTENWKRPAHEVQEILKVMEETAKAMHDRAILEGVQVKILGNLEDERIPLGLKQELNKLQHDTAAAAAEKKNPLMVCIALNYGGRQDIVNAAVRLAVKTQSNQESCAEEVTEDDFAALLCTDGVPDPDLIIRTGGERRLSNFLLWNAAYAELYFSQVLWPDFDDKCLEEALDWYAKRNRRFGGRTNIAHDGSLSDEKKQHGRTHHCRW